MSTLASEASVKPKEVALDVGESKGWPQAEFVYNQSTRNVGYFGGVGIGKTSALVIDAFQYALAWPGSTQVMTEPTFAMVRDVLIPTIRTYFGDYKGYVYDLSERSVPHDVRFVNNSEIKLRSTETGEHLLGTNLARALMDEATLGDQETSWKWLSSRLRQHGYPHQLKLTGTPRGRNWVWRIFFSNDRLTNSKVYTAETADNAHLPEDYLDELLQAYGGWDNPLARQELAGAWLEMAGQVFPQFQRNIHLRSIGSDAPLLKDKMGGIDFGGVSPTALVGAGLTTGGRVHAFCEWYKHEATLDDTIEAMVAMRSQGIKKWVADPSGKEQIRALRKAGLDVRKARHGNKIKLRTQLMGGRLNVGKDKLPGIYFDSACPNLIAELEGLMWRRRKAGAGEEMYDDNFDPTTPDHAFDALVNVLAEYDTQRAKGPKQEQPVGFYDNY